MCGLAGYITKDNELLTREQKIVRGRILNGMLVAMETRGDHSTGVCGVVNGKAKIVKTIDCATDFINLKEYTELMDQSPSIVIGHTRFATHGSIIDENAHPFKIGRIIGSHNGHVNNYKKHFAKAEVDSEAIFHLLDKNNNDYKKTFEVLSGHITATWIDVLHPNKVYLVAHQNPLCMVKVKELNTIFWLSELDFLKSIIEATVGIRDRKFTDIYMNNENEVFKISDKLIVKTEKVDFAIGNTSCTYNDDDFSVNRLIGEKSTSDLEGSVISKEEKREFCKVVGQRQCGYCQVQVPIENGFWFDYENFGVICNLCYSEDSQQMESDLCRWVSYQEYFDLLQKTYDDGGRLVQ